MKNYSEIRPTLDESYAQIFFHDIRRFKVLSEGEQLELVRKAQTGDEKALKDLINSNMRFIVKVINTKSFARGHLTEYVSEAVLGFREAVMKFKIGEGNLLAYAEHWINRNVNNCNDSMEDVVRVPINLCTFYRRLERGRQKYFATFGVYPTDEELAEILGITESEIETAKSSMYSVDLLSHKIGGSDDDDDDKVTVVDTLSDTQIAATDFAVSSSVKREMLLHYINKLDYRSAEIVKDYFGFNDSEFEFTLDSIADKFGITKERVEQIRKKALRELQKMMTSYEYEVAA